MGLIRMGIKSSIEVYHKPAKLVNEKHDLKGFIICKLWKRALLAYRGVF